MAYQHISPISAVRLALKNKGIQTQFDQAFCSLTFTLVPTKLASPSGSPYPEAAAAAAAAAMISSRVIPSTWSGCTSWLATLDCPC